MSEPPTRSDPYALPDINDLQRAVEFLERRLHDRIERGESIHEHALIRNYILRLQESVRLLAAQL